MNRKNNHTFTYNKKRLCQNCEQPINQLNETIEDLRR